MKVLIVGGSGFIGRCLIGALSSADSVFNADINSTFSVPDVQDRFYKMDVTDQEAVRKVVTEVRPDAICHLAGRVSFRWSLENPREDLLLHTLGILNVLDAAARNGTYRPHVIFASSSAVYGRAEKIPTPESCKPNPVSPYGVSKLAGEQYCNLYRELRGIPITILRFSNVYGFGSDHGVISAFIGRIRKGEPLAVNGGQQKIQFVHVDDCVSAITSAIRRRVEGTLNIGGPDVTTLLGLVDLLRKAFNSEVAVQVNPPVEGDIEHTELDTTRARKELYWSPRVTLHEGLEDCAREICQIA